jgi:hypothetical protein
MAWRWISKFGVPMIARAGAIEIAPHRRAAVGQRSDALDKKNRNSAGILLY